jgi:hypothetical protein
MTKLESATHTKPSRPLFLNPRTQRPGCTGTPKGSRVPPFFFFFFFLGLLGLLGLVGLFLEAGRLYHSEAGRLYFGGEALLWRRGFTFPGGGKRGSPHSDRGAPRTQSLGPLEAGRLYHSEAGRLYFGGEALLFRGGKEGLPALRQRGSPHPGRGDPRTRSLGHTREEEEEEEGGGGGGGKGGVEPHSTLKGGAQCVTVTSKAKFKFFQIPSKTSRF